LDLGVIGGLPIVPLGWGRPPGEFDESVPYFGSREPPLGCFLENATGCIEKFLARGRGLGASIGALEQHRTQLQLKITKSTTKR
jgi:hypothetical protein